ncbi:mitochondrial mRNA pseudouridine synthase TRUB2 isoform X2 [Osmerus eperlanus]|uniref:mitochondrial mRNA pseudouridine synthase TRUB2 isoform X2 n=1 Tax=Osmerus eperlanus TaxID=29151 RepID=UPI002E0F093C
MSTPSIRVFRKFEGLFSVYKPNGVHWKLVRDTVETNILKGINAAPPSAPRLRVKFLLGPGGSKGSSDLTLSVASLPALADHPLVSGPEFQQVRVGVGHRLDAFSSGVPVLGVGHGNKALKDLYGSCVTRDYILEGEFGMATNNFTHTGTIIEKTTYDHITRDKLEKVLAMMQGVNQKALLVYSNVDMSSQEAYELAVKGALRPDGKTPPIMLGLRCLHFQPPHFTLEVQCINETQRYLCKVLHEVGLELRSSAVCKGVRRTRDGPFILRDTLTRHHWAAPDVMQAIQQYRSLTNAPKHTRMDTKSTITGTQEDNHTDSQWQEKGRKEAIAPLN